MNRKTFSTNFLKNVQKRKIKFEPFDSPILVELKQINQKKIVEYF